VDILEYFLNFKPKGGGYFPRKLQLPTRGSFSLYGARGVGKTTLLLEYLRDLNEDNWIYIDAQDPTFALEDIDTKSIEEFCKEESISTLAIDHYYDGFLEYIPDIDRVILCSSSKPKIANFPSFELFGLDYEEFIAFNRSLSSSFSRFLKMGTLPISAISQNPENSPLRMRELFYEKFNDQESRLLLILARFQCKRVSAHQIYNSAKEFFRVSKDWIYATLKEFERERIIFFIPELNSRAKKLILYDFILSRYLNKRQPFQITFDAMIALALIKHRADFNSVGAFGYKIEDELISPSAFESEEVFWRRAQSRYSDFISIGIKRVTIVTVSNRYSFSIGKIEFEALPFYEWTLIDDG